MRTFDGDDAGYLAWVDANQDGYVVNSLRRVTAGYLVLHRAACTSICRMACEPIRWTTSAYIKTCAVDLDELERWARDVAGGTLSSCGMCNPV